MRCSIWRPGELLRWRRCRGPLKKFLPEEGIRPRQPQGSNKGVRRLLSVESLEKMQHPMPPDRMKAPRTRGSRGRRSNSVRGTRKLCRRDTLGVCSLGRGTSDAAALKIKKRSRVCHLMEDKTRTWLWRRFITRGQRAPEVFFNLLIYIYVQSTWDVLFQNHSYIYKGEFYNIFLSFTLTEWEIVCKNKIVERKKIIMKIY